MDSNDWQEHVATIQGTTERYPGRNPSQRKTGMDGTLWECRRSRWTMTDILQRPKRSEHFWFQVAVEPKDGVLYFYLVAYPATLSSIWVSDRPLGSRQRRRSSPSTPVSRLVDGIDIVS